MELLHTSGSPITEITETGTFGSFLFFSSSEYVMCKCNYLTYSIEIDESDIIEATSLFYHDDSEKLNTLVAGVANIFGCDEQTARDLMDETETDIYRALPGRDADEYAELSWDTQRYAAEAGRILGYRCTAVRDEQGTSYMIDMLGRENELKLITGE